MKHIHHLLCVLLITVSAGQGYTQAYTPVTVTGFNFDAVCEGFPNTTLFTTGTMDLSNHVLYNQTFAGSAGIGGGMVNTGTITSAGNTYQLAAYTGPNALYLPSGSGTLSLATPAKYNAISIAGFSTEGSSNVQVSLNFSDGTITTFPTVSLSDWFFAAGAIYSGFGRIARVTAAPYSPDGLSTDPRIYTMNFTLACADKQKNLSSITITKTSGGNVFIMAVSANLPTIVTANGGNICPGSSVNLTSSVSTAGGTYSWSPGGATTSSTTVSPSSSTTYTLSYTVGGCTFTDTANVNILNAPVALNVAPPNICPGTSATLTATGADTYTWSPATGLSATTGSSVTASPGSTTTYIVTGTASTGCTGSDTATVTVSPSIPIVVNDAAICLGSDVVLTASGADTYTWSPATGLSATTGTNVTANPTSTSTYNVTGTSAAGCTGTTTVTVTVNSVPTINALASPASYCAGDSATLSATGATTYAWSPAAGLSATTGATVNASPSGSTVYTVIGSSAGCSDTTSVSVTIHPLPVVSIDPVASPVCVTDPPLALNGSPFGGSWAGTGVTASGSFNPSVVSGSSTVTYSVTDANGCTNLDTVVISVSTVPVISITPVAGVCVTGPAFNFSATPAGGTWSGTGITSAAAGTFNPSVAGAGSHTITYTATNGACTSSATTTINVSSMPVINITPVSGVCDESPAFNLSATPVGGTWSGTGITSAAAGTFDPSVAGAGSHTITYTATNGACTTSANITINVNAIPVINIDPAGPVCENQPAFNLTASPSGGTWSGAGIISSAFGTFNPGTAGDGIHPIVYTVPGSSGCSASDTLFLQVDDLPVVTVTPVSTLCTSSSPINLSGTPTGGTWTGTGITSATAGTFDPSVAGTGTHPITYTVTNGTCTIASGTNITVIPGTNITISALGPLVFCQGASVQLVVNGAGSLPVTWSNGQTSDTITVTTGGNYFAVVNGGCGNDTSNILPVTVNTIDASFVLSPTTGRAPLEVSMVNTTSNSASYSWSVNGTNGYAVNTDTTVLFDTTGNFDITIYVISPEGCIDSLTQTVYVFGQFEVIIPNIFTPNGDQANDFFSIQLAGVSELSIDVFNRWGQSIHTYSNTAVPDGKLVVWDGKAKNGDLVSDGVYAFVLKARSLTGDEQVQKGFITLVKEK